MIGQQDFILISSIEWDFLWQGQQEIAARLARSGNRVLYIENTGVRAPRLADARRIYRRVKNWSGTVLSHGLRQVADNLYVCSPLVLPPFGAVWQEILNRRLFLPLISKAVERLRMREPVVWTFLPTNTAVDLMRRLQSPGVVNVYYCIADFGHLTSNKNRLIQSERELLEMCDLVFAQGPELAAHCSLGSKRVHVFSFGVNLDVFPGGYINSSAAANHVGENRSGREDLFKKMKRPIVGYVGGLHRHIDWALLEAIAKDRPDWSWVFVGPQQTSIRKLHERSNVHLVGQYSHAELPAVIEYFDVCIVPYVNSAYTKTVIPTKINEYLSMGKPVVSTPLPAVLEFNHRHEEVVIVAQSRPESFIAALEHALLSATDATMISCRRQVAALNNWQPRVEAMSLLIEKTVKEKRMALT